MGKGARGVGLTSVAEALGSRPEKKEKKKLPTSSISTDVPMGGPRTAPFSHNVPQSPAAGQWGNLGPVMGGVYGAPRQVSPQPMGQWGNLGPIASSFYGGPSGDYSAALLKKRRGY